MRWSMILACLLPLVAAGCAWYVPQPISDVGGSGVVVWWPADPSAVSTDCEVVLVFDRDMDRSSVARSLTVSPPRPVELVWDDARRCRLVPGAGWAVGEVRVKLDRGAQDLQGEFLRQSFVLSFVVHPELP